MQISRIKEGQRFLGENDIIEISLIVLYIKMYVALIDQNITNYI